MPEWPLPELLAHVHDAVVVLDTDAVVLDANPEACRSLGYPRAALVGKHVRDFVEGFGDAAALESLRALVRERGVASLRATHRRADGTRYPVETRLTLVRREGPPLIVVFFRDVTDAEEARSALRDSEERYRRLVELFPDGIITYARGLVTFANPAAVRMAGAAGPEELVGRPILDRVHPDSLASVRERMERVAEGDTVPLSQKKLLRVDGTVFHGEVTAAPLGPGEAIVVIRDGSERRKVEEERAALGERLRQSEKLEALGTLAGGVAHDFNNVLAVILGHADALAQTLPPSSIGRDDAEQIAAAARRARGVVQQILAFARRRPQQAEPVDVARAVREELPLVRAATPADVDVRLRADEDAGTVRADPTQIHQLVLNLCSNARDAMADRGGVLEVTVERAEVPGPGAPPALAPGGYVRLGVADTGAGMDPPTCARAFEPYFTTKPVGVGSGLGLSVVHGIATTLRGAVTLESEPGRGTRVEVWLPRLAPSEAPSHPPPYPVASAHGRILLVDDDPLVARAIARMLELVGYDVTTYEDAESALARFRADPEAFDLLLSDQTLPRMRGDELARAVLALRPAFPVILCTGFSERIDEEAARALGARALLAKPLDMRELSAALRDAIESRRGRGSG